ncbi:MAG: hypothetical protein ACKOCD_10185 [Nitrospiraceae bacterium]
MTRHLPALLASALLTACSSQIQFFGTDDGATVIGTHHIWRQTIEVAMLSGLKLEGPYQPLTTG